MRRRGISLIGIIVTVLIIAILAAVMIPSGVDKINNAKLTSFNQNIITLKQESNIYLMQNNEYPTKNDDSGNPIIYSTTDNPQLVAETTPKGDKSDTFYVIDLDKMKINDKNIGVGKTIDDYYIVARTSGNVYYAKGVKIGNVVHYTKKNKGDGLVAVVPTSAPTPPPYDNPKVPSGFIYVGSETWNTGFTIQDSSGNGNQFVWVPALAPSVQMNGTLDNINFNSKFGRRKFKDETFDSSVFYETNDENLQKMITSVNTYGGFYIAKYEISSANGLNGTSGDKAESKADRPPWVSITWNDAKTKAEEMDAGWDESAVESYLCYGAHWDTALQWLIDSKDKTLAQIKDDSKEWGNYSNVSFTYGASSTAKTVGPGAPIYTGVITDPANRHMSKGIYDLAGNMWEWNMENYTDLQHTCRGGAFYNTGDFYPAAYRGNWVSSNSDATLGFRVVLNIK